MNSARELKSFKGQIRLNEPLSGHTSFAIGGKAKIWAQPKDLASLKQLVKFSAKSAIPIIVIGRGSNLLIGDGPLEAMVIDLSAVGFSQVKIKKVALIAGAGISLSVLIRRCAQAGLGGLEFLAGIPASLGGAIRMNAASLSQGRASSIGELVQAIEIISADGKIKIIKRPGLKFAYKSCLIPNCIIIKAELKLTPRPKKAIERILKENLERKKSTQPLGAFSAGCIFKNPSQAVGRGLAAGYLIEKANLKGKQIGQAQVSELHANYIINKGRAKAKEVLALIELIKLKVKRQFGLTLEPEIKIITNQRKFAASSRVRFL